MRRAAIPILVCLFAPWLGVLGPGIAQAQQPPVTLTLQSQSPWNGPRKPLVLTFRAMNPSQATLDSLSVVLTIEAAVRSRSVYELSLSQTATTRVAAYRFRQTGVLEPGDSRRFRISQPLDALAGRDEAAIHPLEVQLLSQGVVVASLRSPMIFLADRQKVPLNLTWTWVLSAPVRFGPDGTFLDGSLERDISDGGRLNAMVRAIRPLDPAPLDLAVSPVLADQLRRMAAGYRVLEADGTIHTVRRGEGASGDASRMLDSLKDVAAHAVTELVTLPYAEASLPVLIRSGFRNDVARLIGKGIEQVASIVGARPTAGVLRPPLSHIDSASLLTAISAGARTVLLDHDAIPAPEGLPFSPEPVVRLPAGDRSISAVVPDAGVAEAAARFPQDPRLAAQAALGGLAAIYLEFPGTPRRGAAVMFPERPSHGPRFFTAFAALVRESRWLRPVSATELVSIVQDPDPRSLRPRAYPPLPYAGALSRARQSLERFTLATGGARPMTERLRAALSLAESSSFLTQPALGQRFIAFVRRQIRRTYGMIHPPEPGAVVTLASRSAVIPVTVRNDTDSRVRARIKLTADPPGRLLFSGGNPREVTLDPGVQVIRFSVRAQTTGRFPVRVSLKTPGGDLIAKTHMVVRSTAYNRVALFITIGAALFLLAWSGRRFIPRRRG